MSEYELFEKFKKEYCSKCTNECTERNHGITITCDYENKLRRAKCDDYKKKEAINE